MSKIRALPLTITLGSVLLVLALVLTTFWNIVMIYFANRDDLKSC